MRIAGRPAPVVTVAILFWTFAFLLYWKTFAETFTLRVPQLRDFEIESIQIASAEEKKWVVGRPLGSTNVLIQFGSRIVLKVEEGVDVRALIAGMPLVIDRSLGDGVFVLQASDAITALRLSAQLAMTDGVTEVHPIRRLQLRPNGRFAPMPSDPEFFRAWHLENRQRGSGVRNGFDLNARSAWVVGKGTGVRVAVADDGVELTHPDLAANAAKAFHYNFCEGKEDGNPTSPIQIHGTAVAGIVAAVQDNGQGACGVAPEAEICSWIVFDSAGYFIDEETAGQMFQYAKDEVWVQNHSWGTFSIEQYALSPLEDYGIREAVFGGRGGKGVIIVRAAGNERADLRNTNDDGYSQDPRVITVGAVRMNGWPTSYTTPGATVLVGAFSGDSGVDLPNGTKTNYPSIFTTDRVGSLGYNRYDPSGLEDYAYDFTGFSGTSAATPQISGLCALLLSVNTNLSWRDVQQILVLSARYMAVRDPDIQVNGAGFVVSHSIGFGVPDAGMAVRLAQSWQPRPNRTEVRVSSRRRLSIPDDGLVVEIMGFRLPNELASIPVWPTDTPLPDDGTPFVELVDVGLADRPIDQDLRGKAALIQRGGNYFAEKVWYAAQAGAAFAIIYNNTGATERVYASGAEIQFSPIPAVFMDENHGRELAEYLAQNPGAKAAIRLNKLVYELPVNVDLVCEHVALHIQTTHTRRADLRITLVSPSGTRSVLQAFNQDVNSPLDDWTYYSVHHFFEPAYGTWKVEILDQRAGVIGSVKLVELRIFGVKITDSDHDGLDDQWELTNFGSLALGPKDDPDKDGFSNIREYLMGTNPNEVNEPFRIYVDWWDQGHLRLSWPSQQGCLYRLWSSPSPSSFQALRSIQAEVEGQPFETDLILPVHAHATQLFWVERDATQK